MTTAATTDTRRPRQFDPTLPEEILAAVTIGANLLLSPLTRGWYARWGSTADEQRRPLPGDEIVPAPKLVTTRAITIRAAPGEIWPWLLQMGYGRGGLYSYQKLENLARCDIHNADRIHPEWQSLAIGDRVGFGPEGYPYQVVRAIDPDRSFILGSPPQEQVVVASWAFVLEPTATDQTRLIVRNRSTYGPGFLSALIWRGITDPIFFVMERRMLIGIRDGPKARTRGRSPSYN